MGVSFWQLLIIFGIILILFGGKKLRTLGGDLGAAIKGFRTSMSDEDKNKENDPEKETTTAKSIDADGQTRQVDAEVLRQKDKDRA